MKVSPTLMVLLGACAVFLFSPYVPNMLLEVSVGNRVGSFLLLVAILYVLSMNRVLGLACFLAAAALFLEQRRRKVERVAAAMSGSTVNTDFQVEQLDKPAPPIVPGEVHPPHQEPLTDEHGFEPSEETGTNKFDEPAESYDDKHPLETVPPQPGEVSEFLQSRGLASIATNASNAA